MEKKKMTKEAAIELLKNRKVYVNGKSAEIQKKLFELGFKWQGQGLARVINENSPFIYTNKDMFLGHSSSMNFFKANQMSEISAEEILAIEVVEELKENDLVVSGYKFGEESIKWVSVVAYGDIVSYYYLVSLFLEGCEVNQSRLQFNSYANAQKWTRPATEEEKRKLIDALKLSSDKRAKKILKEVFGIEQCLFKPFDKVLVRNSNGMVWGARLFDRMHKGYYACTDSLCYKQCIPFEGNESLHGTADSPNNQKKEVEQ